MIKLLTSISNLIQNGMAKQQAIHHIVKTNIDEPCRAAAIAYFHKNIAGR